MISPFLKKYWLLLSDKLKYSKFLQAVFLYRSISTQFPSCLNIELTNRCNLHCNFCPRDHMNRAVGDISNDLIVSVVIPQLKKIPSLNRLLLFKDGEPLLHPQFSQITKLIKEAQIAHRIEIHTNAVNLNPNLAGGVIDSGLDVLIVSLDALNSKDYSNLKGVGAFDLVLQNIRSFINIKKERGALFPVVVIRGVDQGLPKFKQYFYKKFSSLGDMVEVAPLHYWDGSVGKVKKDNFSRRWPCVIPWYNPVILWDGRLSACCINYQDNELVMGDLKKEDIVSIWRGEKYKSLRQAHLTNNFSDWPTCANCPHWRAHPGWVMHLKKSFL